MKRKTIGTIFGTALLTAFLFVCSTFTSLSFAAADDNPFAGKGTKASPYLISSADDLNDLSALVGDDAYNSAYYLLTDDIVLNEGIFTLSGNKELIIPAESEKFQPIGNADKPFRGVFDGAFHSISGIYVDGDIASLFGANDGEIKNLVIENSLFSGKSAAGVAAANLKNGNISNVAVNCVIVATELGGGVACDNAGTITNVSSNCAYSAPLDCFGGITGNNSGILSDFYLLTDDALSRKPSAKNAVGTTVSGYIGESATLFNVTYTDDNASISPTPNEPELVIVKKQLGWILSLFVLVIVFAGIGIHFRKLSNRLKAAKKLSASTLMLSVVLIPVGSKILLVVLPLLLIGAILFAIREWRGYVTALTEYALRDLDENFDGYFDFETKCVYDPDSCLTAPEYGDTYTALPDKGAISETVSDDITSGESDADDENPFKGFKFDFSTTTPIPVVPTDEPKEEQMTKEELDELDRNLKAGLADVLLKHNNN